MSNKQFTVVEMSQDELAFILTLSNLNEISGFAVPSDFDEAAASAAGDTLLARGLGVATNDGPALHREVTKLVTIGALYSVALGINIVRGGGAPERTWFYLTADQAVMHSKPRLDTERFELLTNAADLAEQITTLLNAKSHTLKPGFGGFIVPKAVLAKAEALKATHGDQAAVDALQRQNLPASFASNVLDEHKQIICVTIRVAETKRGEVRAESNTAMLITTSNGFWLLEEDPSEVEHLNATPIDGVGALAYLAQLVAL